MQLNIIGLTVYGVSIRPICNTHNERWYWGQLNKLTQLVILYFELKKIYSEFNASSMDLEVL